MMKHFVTTQYKQWEAVIEQSGLLKDTAPESITVSASERDMVWEGFGGCFNELGKKAIDELPETEQNALYDKLFSKNADGLNLDFCRIPLGASDYALDWYSCNEHPDDFEMKHFSIERDKKLLIPYIKEALKRNPHMGFFASPWSPPTWMKNPGVYNYGRLIWTPENLKAYALYLMKFIQAYEQEGIKISQLHVQNEVTSDQKFPSCLWSGDQLAEFIGDYLGPLFEENQITTEIWLGTINATGFHDCPNCPSSNRYDMYAHRVLDNKKAYSYIKGVAYQWEGKYALQPTVDSYPELRYMQSENECGDGSNTWEYAKYIFELLRHYMSNGVSSYIYWNMVLKPYGESTWGWKQNAMITIDDKVNYEYEYYIMKHVSHFVKIGAKILKVKGHMAANTLAFQNPDSTRIFIIQNPFPYEKAIVIEDKTLRLEADSIHTIVF